MEGLAGSMMQESRPASSALAMQAMFTYFRAGMP